MCYGLCINLETVPRSASDCVIAEPIVYALKNKKRVKSSRKNVVRQHLLVIRDDNTILCVKKEKLGDDGDLADVTHSLFRRVIAVIAGHARRSWILARRLHALGYFLEAILPHLNPLRHVAHRSVLCEEEESTGMKTRNHSMPRHDCHCKTRAVSPVHGSHFHPSRISLMLALPVLV